MMVMVDKMSYNIIGIKYSAISYIVVMWIMMALTVGKLSYKPIYFRFLSWQCRYNVIYIIIITITLYVS